MALPATYKTGKATIKNGSKDVTGNGTNWLFSGLRVGDIFWLGGTGVTIASINSATSITLDHPWAANSATNADYEIRYVPDDNRVLESTQKLLQKLLEGEIISFADVRVKAGPAGSAPKYVDGVLTLPVGAPGKNGAVDFGDINVATGAAGSEVVYDRDREVLFIPRGDPGDTDFTNQLSALSAEIRDGRVWQFNGTSPSGSSPTPSANLIITVGESNAPQGELETDIIKKDATGQLWWGLLDSSSISEPRQIVINESSPSDDRNMDTWTEANRYYDIQSATLAQEPLEISDPVTAKVSVKDTVGGVEATLIDQSGRTFSRIYNGTNWSEWVEKNTRKDIKDRLASVEDSVEKILLPQIMGRGDSASVVEINGKIVISAGADGRIRFVPDDWTVESLASRLNITGTGAAPVSPALLGNIDGWSVWQADNLLTFSAIIDPFSYPREYVMKPGGDPWVNGDPIVPIRLIYGDGLGLAPASEVLKRVTQLLTLDDGAGQDGLDGAAPSAPATGIAPAGAGFAALSADIALSRDTGLARWVAVRSEAVSGAGLTDLQNGQSWDNLVRAKEQFVEQLAEYGRNGQLDAITIMHGAGDDSISYESDLLSLLAKIESIGARQINVFVPCGTTERGNFASTLATIEAFRNKGSLPMRLVAPLYPYPRTGLATPSPESVTMLAELDAYCAADPNWLPPLAFTASRNGTTVNVDFEVMEGRYLHAPSTVGWSYSGANVISVKVVNDPITVLPTRVAVELDAAVTGTLSYAYGPDEAKGKLRDDWTAPSRTGQPLYRYALPFTFEVN